MRNRKLAFLVAIAVILLCAATFAETKKLTSIGRYTFVQIRGKVPTQEVMKRLFERYAGDIKLGFDMAGAGDLYLPFLEQLKTATFVDTTVPVGDKLMWMLFRSRGKVKIVHDIEWAGKAPLEVFAFRVMKDYKQYEFVMPKPCGNISLRKIEDLTPPPPDSVCGLSVAPAKVNIKGTVAVDMSGSKNAAKMEVDVFGPDGAKITTHALTPASPKVTMTLDQYGDFVFKGRAFNLVDKVSVNPCEGKVHVNFPPVCTLWTSCLPCEDYVGKPITFDATGSTDPDGQVVRADFEITDEAGNTVDKFSDAEKPFTWEKIFKKPGIYAINCVVTDDFGAVSEPARIVFEVTQKKVFFLAEGGPFLSRGTHGFSMAARLGLFYWLVPDKLNFLLSGGASLNLSGEPWKSFFLANVLLNHQVGAVYFGGGLGFTTGVKEGRGSDADLIGNLGVNVFNTFTSIGSVFLELRNPVGEGRSFSKHHKFMLGFRMLF